MEQIIDETVNADIEGVAQPQAEETIETELEQGEKDSADAEQKPVQDDATNAKFAEMRRRLEAAEARAKKADDVVSKTWGDRGITTLDQLEAQLEKERVEAERQELIDKGYDPDELDKIIDKKLNSHPSVVAARQSELNSYVSSQLGELNTKFGLDLKTVEDINELPNAEAMIKKINQGYDWQDAYLITHYDQVANKTAEKAKQAALNNQNSKSHLKTSAGGGDVDTFVMPADTMAEYKRMFAKELRQGKMTEKDFVTHYRKSNGK